MEKQLTKPPSTSDFIRSQMQMQEWNPKDITKIPVELLYHKNGAFLTFNLLLQGLDILGVYMKKSQEWFYGIYEGSQMKGYLHFGKIPFEKHAEIVQSILPADINRLQILVDQYDGRNDYHLSTAESFQYVGQVKDRPIIKKIYK